MKIMSLSAAVLIGLIAVTASAQQPQILIRAFRDPRAPARFASGLDGQGVRLTNTATEVGEATGRTAIDWLRL